MMVYSIFITAILLAFEIVQCDALYDSSDDVVELTSQNFQKRVIGDDAIWIVEFYAPWCGHCKSLVPEYKKASTALKGFVKVGAVDMTQHESIGGQYGIRGFPTIKIFGTDKQKPSDYNGPRTAQNLVESAINEIKKIASSRLGGGSQYTNGRSSSSQSDVVELTDSNFEQKVLNSKELWMVEFYAPWCGHCKNLEPHWKSAARELKGKIMLGALDATVHTMMANRLQIRGFPTIKFFGSGSKSVEDGADYDGGRTSADIVQWALAKVSENLPPPELKQLTSTIVYEEACKERQLCIIAFLPHILDCQSGCRNKYISLLKDLGEKFKKSPWGWVWIEAVQQPELEDAFGIGGFGYPAMVAVNSRKLKYSTLTGPFTRDGISEYLRDLSYGRGKTSSMKGTQFPTIQGIQEWDGKDAEPPQLDELDLSDVELEEMEKTEL